MMEPDSMPPGGPLPHLVHIGFPKAGSTWLQRWFNANPQVLFRDFGIAGYASVDELALQAALPSPQWRCRVTSGEKLSEAVNAFDPRPGEPTGPQARRLIRDTLAILFPDAWILIVTRNRGEAFVSGYSELVRQGYASSFGDHAAHAARVFAERGEAHRDYSYSACMDDYRQCFGDRVIALPFELLRHDPRRFVEPIERAMRLDPFDMPQGRVNSSLGPAELALYPRLAHAIQRLPVGRRLRNRLALVHRKSIQTGSMRGLAEVLGAWWGPETPDSLGFAHLQHREDTLLELPDYQPYRTLYGG